MDFKTVISQIPDTQTENGAPSFSTTGSGRLDYFAKFCGAEENQNLSLHDPRVWETLTRAWNDPDPQRDSKLDTLKLIFYKRDIQRGAGERRLFHTSFEWLLEHHPATAFHNLRHLPHFGYWKDLLSYLEHPKTRELAFKLWSEQLIRDWELLETEERKGISLCAKWAPSLGKSFHRRCPEVVRRLALSLPGVTAKRWPQDYRRFLRRLRTHLGIVEQKICSGEWKDIDYSRVPSIAMKNYGTVFRNHDGVRFTEWLHSVGKNQIKVGALYPHQIVDGYLKCFVANQPLNPLLEEQWKAMVERFRSLETGLKETLVMCDVSGSMYSGQRLRPITVSVALGILIATLLPAPFDRCFLSFTDRPRFHEIHGESLLADLQTVVATEGFNTNLHLAFQEILSRAQAHRLPPEKMPRRLLILSDMQFDQIHGSPLETNFEAIQREYQKAGYQLPQIVFWNLMGETNDFPVRDGDLGACLISGFSPAVLRAVLENGVVNPYQVMCSSLDQEFLSSLEVIPDDDKEISSKRVSFQEQ